MGIEVISDTFNDFLCLCPFHGNTNTPSFSVSKTTGKYICFNEACAEAGSLVELIKTLQKKNDFEALRMISRAKDNNVKPFSERLAEQLKKKELTEFSGAVIDRLAEDIWNHPEALEYMHSRGFTDEILRSYKVGYSAKKGLITVPMYSERGMPIGMIGRSIKDKRFKNSDNLPVRQTLWNLHRAIRTGSQVVIVVESTFDGMMLAQAGYPNVVACLGGNFNELHAEQLKKYFNTVIIMTDWDDSSKHNYDKGERKCRKCREAGYRACKGHNPGRDTGNKIANLMRGKVVKWASYDHGMVYPAGVKDACDMTIVQIRKCVQDAVSNLEYQRWNLYYQPQYNKVLAERALEVV